MTLEASIIVPTYNQAARLDACLRSLMHVNYDPNKFEILIVDNGSSDNTWNVVDEAMRFAFGHSIHYIYEPEPGLLSGRHRGAMEARANILAFVDDDVEVHVDWLSSMVQTFADNEVHLVGGRNLPNFEEDPPSWCNYFWTRYSDGRSRCGYWSLLDWGDDIRVIGPNLVWGLNFAIRRRTLFDAGGFHPDTVPKHLQRYQGDGETGLTLNIKRLGLKTMYQPRMLVKHAIPKERMTVEYFENRQFFQGVCDSYTSIRSRGSVGDLHTEAIVRQSKPEAVSSPKASLREHIRRHYRKCRSFVADGLRRRCKAHEPVERIRNRVQFAYQAGYEFHQNAVRDSPALLQWVLQEDYWDYRLPREPSLARSSHASPSQGARPY